MSVKRVNLLADFTFFAPDGAVRTFSAGVRNLPVAAAAAAAAAGQLGKLPRAKPVLKVPAKTAVKPAAKPARKSAKR